MESAFGVDHGEVSKGLPRAVADGGGGRVGDLMRGKNKMGKLSAKHPSTRRITTISGRSFKEGLEGAYQDKRVAQVAGGKASRRIRAGLLNEDSAARRKGYKTGKSSALDRGYRGRVSSPMKELP